MEPIKWSFSKVVGLLLAILPEKDYVTDDFKMKFSEYWFCGSVVFSDTLQAQKWAHQDLRLLNKNSKPLPNVSSRWQDIKYIFWDLMIFNSATEGEKSHALVAVDTASYFSNHASIQFETRWV